MQIDHSFWYSNDIENLHSNNFLRNKKSWRDQNVHQNQISIFNANFCSWNTTYAYTIIYCIETKSGNKRFLQLRKRLLKMLIYSFLLWKGLNMKMYVKKFADIIRLDLILMQHRMEVINDIKVQHKSKCSRWND